MKNNHGKTTYLYQAYNLNIESEIKLYDWLEKPSENDFHADVTIQYGKINSFIDFNYEPRQPKEPWFKVINNKQFINIDNVAYFLICDDNTIIVEPYPNANADSLQVYLFCMGMTAILMKKGYLLLHCCGIVYNKGVYVFMGPSGIGKSTLAASFLQAGYSIMCDDMCPIKTFNHATPMAYPSYPRIKVLQTTADKLNIDTKPLQRVCPEEEKYYLPITDQWHKTPLPLKQACLINTTDENTFSILPLKGIEKMTLLRYNTFRYYFLNELNLSKDHFEQSKALLDHVPVSLITRPNNQFLIDELRDYIIENVFEKNDG